MHDNLDTARIKVLDRLHLSYIHASRMMSRVLIDVSTPDSVLYLESNLQHCPAPCPSSDTTDQTALEIYSRTSRALWNPFQFKFYQVRLIFGERFLLPIYARNGMSSYGSIQILPGSGRCVVQ